VKALALGARALGPCAVGLGALGLCLLSGCEFRGELSGNKKQSPPPAPVLAPGQAPTPVLPTPAAAGRSGHGPAGALQPSGAPDSFAPLAQASDAAVVFVRTVSSQRRGFSRVLAQGSGSGFVFDPAGKILTNYHVVQGAHAIEVEFSDDRTFMAQVVGADPHTDVAVIAIEATGLPALPLGDSDQVRVGDWVLAIGNPFGLSHTVSAGIISARGRSGQDVKLDDPSAYYNFLQTDASINPGNSGGPLIDLSGRVVGMNTAINPEANSIGFAIPVNMLRELLPRLLSEGVVRRAAIGVHVDIVDRQLQVELGLPDRRGALIRAVQPDGPAAEAGLMPGDVVVEYGGKPIATPEDLRWHASLSPIGQPAGLTVLRAGKRVAITVKPAPMAGR